MSVIPMIPSVAPRKQPTTATTALAAVVPIGMHRGLFAAGTEARHCTLGWVLVELALENRRLVRWYDFKDVPASEFSEDLDHEGDPVIEEQEIAEHHQWVCLSELRRVAKPDLHRPHNWQRLARVGALRVADFGPIERIERYRRPQENPAGGSMLVGKGGVR